MLDHQVRFDQVSLSLPDDGLLTICVGRRRRGQLYPVPARGNETVHCNVLFSITWTYDCQIRDAASVLAASDKFILPLPLDSIRIQSLMVKTIQRFNSSPTI